jgi:hypothetical protein
LSLFRHSAGGVADFVHGLASFDANEEHAEVMTFQLASLFDDPMTKWTVICAVILTIIYAVFRSGYRKKDPLNRSSAPVGHLAQQRAVEREMSNVLVELSEMARQITAQLDSRAARLEALIQEADQKIARLSEAPPAGESLRPGPPPQQMPPPPDSRHQMIYDLADQGLTPRDIAARLRQPSGEIELILALRAKIDHSTAIQG